MRRTASNLQGGYGSLCKRSKLPWHQKPTSRHQMVSAEQLLSASTFAEQLLSASTSASAFYATGGVKDNVNYQGRRRHLENC